MKNHEPRHFSPITRFAVVTSGALLLTAACASDDPGADEAPTSAGADASSESTATNTIENTTTTGSNTTLAPDTVVSETTATEATGAEPETTPDDAPSDEANSDDATSGGTGECDDVAALFVTRGSANADLDDPEVSASCDGESIVVTSNGIPDYTYVETSPGAPRVRDLSYTIPALPTLADAVTAVPLVGTAAVTLSGIPVFGPTEGTGGDVESLPGILSDCGSHNGPSGFHIHLILTSSETDCLFTPEAVAAEPQLVGYAFDGYPIYTGIDQYTSSWELTDETLFATDTWAAHAYVEGSGDLDECNGRTDDEGNYAYYTTATFPYILGCYTGVVDLEAAGGGGGGGDVGERPGRPDDDPEADGDDRPERPEDEAEGVVAGERPERPEPPEGDAGGERPQRPTPPDEGIEGGNDPSEPPAGDEGQ